MSDKELLAEAKSIVSRWRETDIFKGITVRKDNRITAHGVADYKKRTLTINCKRINNLHSLRLVVLHELGHFYHEKEEKNDEYLAHKFALETLKVFYGEESYGYALECLKATIEADGFKEAHPEHYNAFKRLHQESEEADETT